ncbi:MAG: hypothetical protein HZC37_27190 [Burkholderiales bacterium]|nr:hypothetical protein [Burkholderiales bacterium]
MHLERTSLVPLLQAARRTRRRFALAVMAAVLGCGLLAGILREAAAAWPVSRAQARLEAGSESVADATARRQDAAFQALRGRRFAEAYGQFAALADEGHGGAALMALALVRHGAELNGNAWSATPGQLRRWSALAAQDLRDRAGQLALHDRGE